MPDLTTRYLGLPLKNPIVPSSTPLTRDADAPLHLKTPAPQPSSCIRCSRRMCATTNG
jgi:hypothetical protein